jgi:hypothetical protein
MCTINTQRGSGRFNGQDLYAQIMIIKQYRCDLCHRFLIVFMCRRTKTYISKLQNS